MRAFMKHRSYMFFVVLSGNILAFINDTPVTWSSPMLPKLLSSDQKINPLGRPISTNEESWIVSLLSAGAVIGALPFGLIADRIGRKPVLLFLAIPHFIAFCIFAFDASVKLYYVARFLNGLSFMGCYVVLPMYMAEISEESYRGILIGTYTVSSTFGDLFCYLLGPYLSIKYFNLVLAAFPLIFFMSFLLIAPESPHYLVGRNDTKALESLHKLRSGQNVRNELQTIQIEKEKNERGAIIETLKKRYVMKGCVIALGVIFLQQLTGISVILAYTQLLFQQSGVDMPSEISSIIVGTALFLATICGLFLVEKKGRKFLLICSALGMMSSLTVLGIYFLLQEHTKLDMEKIIWLPVPCFMVYALSFSTGFGPLTLTVSNEILPSNVKFYLTSLGNSIQAAITFMLTIFFNDLADAYGYGVPFLIFAGFAFLSMIFVLFIVPETKGKSFHEIHVVLDRKSFFLHNDLFNFKNKRKVADESV